MIFPIKQIFGIIPNEKNTNKQILSLTSYLVLAYQNTLASFYDQGSS